MTTASPQPAEPFSHAIGEAWPSAGGQGLMFATVPSAHWSAATSRSHLVLKPATS